MKLLVTTLVVLLLLLQYRFWSGDGGVREVWSLRQQLAQQQRENAGLRERNRALEADVTDLKSGVGAIEERARNELGMIKKDETFFQAVDE